MLTLTTQQLLIIGAVVTLVIVLYLFRRMQRETKLNSIVLLHAVEATVAAAKLASPVTNPDSAPDNEERVWSLKRLHEILFSQRRGIIRVDTLVYTNRRWESTSFHWTQEKKQPFIKSAETVLACEEARRSPTKTTMMTLPSGDTLFVSVHHIEGSDEVYAVVCELSRRVKPDERESIHACSHAIATLVYTNSQNTGYLLRSETDPLTGAKNRRGFLNELARFIKIQERQLEQQRKTDPESTESVIMPEGFGIISLDLNGMKAVNDTYGHPAGDELLRQVVAHLIAILRGDDRVARTGGDEILILTHATGKRLIAAAKRIIRSFRKSFSITTQHHGSVPVEISLSIGILTVNLAHLVDIEETFDDELFKKARESCPELTDSERVIAWAHTLYTQVDQAETQAKGMSRKLRATQKISKCAVLSVWGKDGCEIIPPD